MRRAHVRRLACSLLVLAVGMGACCRRPPTVIHMAAPQDRYDHNRAQQIVSPAIRDGKPTRVTDEVYTPLGRESFPTVHFVSGSPSSDGVPVAGLVPVFTGVPLPLSADGNPSDRDDLIDFLAQGPDAQGGIEPAEMPGAIKETERHFKAVLDLLSSAQQLGGAKGVQDWAATRDVTWTQAVVDSRYRVSAFADRIAVYCDHFWFVMYRLPDQDHLTRLVVLPEHTTRQDFEDKRPVGNDGRCGEGK